MTFTTLYANGCSMTKHSVLAEELHWPHLLGKSLSIPKIINDGIGCGSNSRILRTTLNFLSNRTDTNSMLVIIQLTNPFRFEFQEQNKNWGRCNNNSVVCDDVSYAKTFSKLKMRYYSQESEFYELIQQAYAIEHLLKSFNVKQYFFVNYGHILEFDKIDKSLLNSLEKISWLYDNFDESSIFKPKYSRISDSDGHPNEAGNDQIKNWMLAAIKDKLK